MPTYHIQVSFMGTDKSRKILAIADNESRAIEKARDMYPGACSITAMTFNQIQPVEDDEDDRCIQKSVN
ncbi:hypothetical protein [Pseudomonas akapageensis]|uniref:hypothetical protein n=1 Tax=Pseudomonas akapageensis TaxID=2609961 RepID=UPI0014094DCC|nr:hypothetical protein [Pseudomonas akapageensis]